MCSCAWAQQPERWCRGDGEEGLDGSLPNMAPLSISQAATESFLSETNGTALGERCIILGLSTAYSRI